MQCATHALGNIRKVAKQNTLMSFAYGWVKLFISSYAVYKIVEMAGGKFAFKILEAFFF